MRGIGDQAEIWESVLRRHKNPVGRCVEPWVFAVGPAASGILDRRRQQFDFPRQCVAFTKKPAETCDVTAGEKKLLLENNGQILGNISMAGLQVLWIGTSVAEASLGEFLTGHLKKMQ